MARSPFEMASNKTDTTRYDLWWRVKTLAGRVVVTHPGKVIGVLMILTLVPAWPITRLQTRTSIYDLIIEDLPDTIACRMFQKQFGTADIIRNRLIPNRLTADRWAGYTFALFDTID